MIYLDVTSSCKSPMNTGVQRVVRGIFRGLAQAGATVVPLLWEPGLESYCTLTGRERAFLERPFAGLRGRKARAEPGRAANAVPVWSKFWRQVQHRRNRMDLIARMSAADALFVPEIFQDSRVAWLGGLRGRTAARAVAVFHDGIAWRRPDITPPARQAGFLEYMRALRNFDEIIAVSREAAGDLRDCWKAEATANEAAPEISVMGWPADEMNTRATGETGSPAPIPSRRASFDAAAQRTVLCVGTFEPRKNHLTLLAAAQRLWREGVEFKLVLVGRTTAQFGGTVLAEIERLRAEGRAVEWRRHVDDDGLAAAYAECGFTVFPSLVEGFGLPIVESLRRGRPCVCGDNGALGEVSSGGGCLIVDQTDAASLAAGMRLLLTDIALYERLVDEARARRFDTWADYVAKLLPRLAVAGRSDINQAGSSA